MSTLEDSDDEGEDLMESDEEEESESETEEDRAFIDDEVVEDQGVSFYRVFDREREGKEEKEYLDTEEMPKVTDPEPYKKKEHPLKKLRDRLVEYLGELPVLGFNSGKYDLNVVKEFLFPVLVQNEQVQFTISLNSNFICLKTRHLRFLDVTNLLAPSFSCDMFLKAYECPHTKGVFRYEWMDSLDKLEHTSLPPHAACYSSLKKDNISREDYQTTLKFGLITTCKQLKISCLVQHLDVQPFCDALEKMCTFWKNENIDMLRQGISIPGVSLAHLFSTLESGIFFSLFDEKNKHLYYLFKKNMVKYHFSPLSWSRQDKDQRKRNERSRKRGKDVWKNSGIQCQSALSMGHYAEYAYWIVQRRNRV